MINLSIIIPVFNESNYLMSLFSDLDKYFNDKATEIVFINDGSTDNSKNLISNYINSPRSKSKKKLINFSKNSGKGKAVREGIKASLGKYILLQDADLELDLKDSKELYNIIKNNDAIKCIFGSRYLSGKLKKNNYFFNQLIVKINSIIFNLFFSQSLSDIHCGLKILHRDVVNKLNLKVNDFGLEIELASQIVRNNFFIYEYGVSYYFRTKQEGKKITWYDGIKSYYYLFKSRFVDNEFAVNLSVIYSSAYMAFLGYYLVPESNTMLFVILFLILGSFIGLKYKIMSSSIIFLFIYLGSLIGDDEIKVVSIPFFFFLSLYVSNSISIFIKNLLIKNKSNKFILNYLF